MVSLGLFWWPLKHLWMIDYFTRIIWSLNSLIESKSPTEKCIIQMLLNESSAIYFQLKCLPKLPTWSLFRDQKLKFVSSKIILNNHRTTTKLTKGKKKKHHCEDHASKAQKPSGAMILLFFVRENKILPFISKSNVVSCELWGYYLMGRT